MIIRFKEEILRCLIRKFWSFAKSFMGLLVLNHVIQIISFAFVLNIYKLYKTMYRLLNENAKLIIPYKLDYDEILEPSNFFYALVTLSALTNVCLSLTIQRQSRKTPSISVSYHPSTSYLKLDLTSIKSEFSVHLLFPIDGIQIKFLQGLM